MLSTSTGSAQACRSMNGQCYEALLPCTLRQAQGERKRTLGIVFPGSSPFDRLRANGSAFWGSSSLAVHPSTGSGRTDCALWGSSFPAVHPSTGSGRTEVHFGDRLPRLFALRQAQANGSALRGSSSLAVHPSTGSGRTEAHFGDRLPWQFTLRQAQGERITLSTAKRIHSPSRGSRALSGIAQMPPVASPENPSQTSRRCPLWHCLRAL